MTLLPKYIDKGNHIILPNVLSSGRKRRKIIVINLISYYISFGYTYLLILRIGLLKEIL